MIAGFALTPRQTRTALDLLTGLVVASVAIALAGLTWRLAGHAGTGAITVPSGDRAPTVSADLAPAIALAPFGKAPLAESGQATALPLVLKGVVAAQPASLSTAFISLNGEPALPYRVGENVGGATVQAILRDRVILSNAGRNEYLPFPDPTLAANGQQPAAPARASTTSAPVAASPPAPVTAPPAASILQRFNATPADGGYRVGENGPPGLLPGDVLMSVNGTALSDQNAAGAAYAAAQQAGSATLQIMRDGKRLTLTVPLR